MASIKRMESEVDQCTQSIQALHSDLDAAGKQNDEAREDSTAERFAGIKYVPVENSWDITCIHAKPAE